MLFGSAYNSDQPVIPPFSIFFTFIPYILFFTFILVIETNTELTFK